LIDTHEQAIVLASGAATQALQLWWFRDEIAVVIVIFYAFGREVGALKRKFETRAALEIAGLSGFRGKLGGAEVAAIATGIGTDRAREAARRTFDSLSRDSLSRVDFAISTGVAGALSEGLLPGDLVVADRLIASTGAGSDRISSMSAADLDRVKDALRAAAVRFSTGAILTSARPLLTAPEKRRAKSATGAIAVEMESAVLAEAAQNRGIPFACVRAILDTADEEVVGAELADQDGRVRPIKAAGFIVRHPAAILALPRIARNLGLASKSIAGAIEAIVRHAD